MFTSAAVPPIVFALGPEANHYITVSHASNFRWRDGAMGDLIPLLGDGLLTTDGDYHRRARRIMLPAFHREQLAESTAIMVEEAESAIDAWRAGQRLDLYAWTRRLALRDCDAGAVRLRPRARRPRREMAERVRGDARLLGQGLRGADVARPGLAVARDEPGAGAARPGDLRGDRPPPRERRARRGHPPLLLDAEDEDGSRLSDQELRDQVMTLLFAGHDTATSTVTFLFYELARNPG